MEHHPDGPSRLPRRVLCPASYRLERKAPEEKPSREALRGTLLHKAALSNEVVDVPESDKWLVQKAKEYLKEKEVAFGEGKSQSEIRVEIPGLYFGTLDWIMQDNADGFIVDLKFGLGTFSRHYEHYQLMAYALPILLKGIKFVDVFAYHVQSGTELTERFTSEEAPALQVEIEGIIEMARDPQSEARPSEEACRYCRAKSICPAFRSEIALPVPAGPSSQALWSPRDWEKALDLASKVHLWQDWSTQVRARAKELMAKGELTLPGWSVGNRYIREVVDVAGAYHALAGVVTQEEFLKICEAPVGALENIFVERLSKRIGGTKKALRDQFTETLTGNKSMIVNLQTYLKKEGR
jgi:hypothetical protein